MRLNQIIALVQGKKARATKLLTSVHQGWQKERISGLNRTYSPKDEEGEVFPSESKVVQVTVKTALQPAIKELADFYNIVITQETANTQARASIIVEDDILFEDIPVSALLFLEKQLIDLHTLTKNLPTLPEDKEWSWDDAKNCWVSKPEQTNKTQKKVEPIVKYDATPEHPAQTDLVQVDRTIGWWTTIHLSGALPKTKQEDILQRIEKLQDAVKVAREEANNLEVVQEKQFGEKILDYIFTS
jgi:hypothetical protein